MAAAAALAGVAAIVTVHGQPANAFRASRDHPAIAYSTGPVDNAIVDLNRRLGSGAAQLEFDERSGYLRLGPRPARHPGGVAGHRLLAHQQPGESDQLDQSARHLFPG